MPQNKITKRKKSNLYNIAAGLCNDLLKICFDEYCDLYDMLNAKRNKMDLKYDLYI